MIVRPVADGLLLVTQPDHASLAAEILEHYDLEALPRPWQATLRYATRQHDNGWLEVDARPSLGEHGRPYDFLGAPDEVRQAIWPRAVARLAGVSRGAAALVAQHALTIYSRYEHDPAWAAFFTALVSTRDRELRAAGAGSGEMRRPFERAYDYLHMADLASLVFSNGSTAAHDDRGHRFLLVGDTLTIAPDPFAGRLVDLRVRGRVIPEARYGSNEALRLALWRAPDRWLTGVAMGA